MKIVASEDLELIAPLLKELQEHHRRLAPSVFKEVPETVYKKVIANALATGEHHFYLACQAGTPVGMIWLEELAAQENDLLRIERSLHISGLVTQDQLRGQGIAQALLAQAEALAREKNYPQLTLDFWAVNDLRDFYAKQGYQPCKFKYYKTLV